MVTFRIAPIAAIANRNAGTVKPPYRLSVMSCLKGEYKKRNRGIRTYCYNARDGRCNVAFNAPRLSIAEIFTLNTSLWP